MPPWALLFFNAFLRSITMSEITGYDKISNKFRNCAASYVSSSLSIYIYVCVCFIFIFQFTNHQKLKRNSSIITPWLSLPTSHQLPCQETARVFTIRSNRRFIFSRLFLLSFQSHDLLFLLVFIYIYKVYIWIS